MTEGSDHQTKPPTKRPRRTGRRPEATGRGASPSGAGGQRIDRAASTAAGAAASSDWAAIGTVLGTFGLHGDLKIQPLTDFPERFERTPTIYVGAAHTPRRVSGARIHGRLVILHLEGVETATDGEKLRGQPLSIPAVELLALPQDSYYLHDLIGLRVEHVDGAPLGVVADVLTGAGNDLFVVRTPTGGEALVPAVKEFVKSVDVRGGVVRVEPIPGLFDDRAVVAEESAPHTTEGGGTEE